MVLVQQLLPPQPSVAVPASVPSAALMPSSVLPLSGPAPAQQGSGYSAGTTLTDEGSFLGELLAMLDGMLCVAVVLCYASLLSVPVLVVFFFFQLRCLHMMTPL